MAAPPFQPKQALKFDGALLEELQAGVSNEIARQILTLVPAITKDAIIHDNGCGPGAVTEEIMGTSPPAEIKIHSTDINPAYLAELDTKVDANKWPVSTATMDAEALTFPDNHFSLSVSNFIFGGLRDKPKAAEHILRTVKPGGHAVIATWDDMPWSEGLAKAHCATRGGDAPLPPYLYASLHTEENLRPILEQGGWTNVHYVKRMAPARHHDARRWAVLAWSLLGATAGGWTVKDEENWDEAIRVIMEHNEGIRIKESEQLELPMSAVIAIVQK